jgi:hypothetical protein
VNYNASQNMGGPRIGTGTIAGQTFTLSQAGIETPRRPVIRRTQGVLQAFSNSQGASSGTWLTVYGTDFTTVSNRVWAGDDFTGNRGPNQLGGVMVMVNNRPGFVSFVDRGEQNNPDRPAQINFQVPDDDTLGPVQIQVVGPGGTSDPVSSCEDASFACALYRSELYLQRQAVCRCVARGSDLRRPGRTAPWASISPRRA